MGHVGFFQSKVGYAPFTFYYVFLDQCGNINSAGQSDRPTSPPSLVFSGQELLGDNADEKWHFIPKAVWFPRQRVIEITFSIQSEDFEDFQFKIIKLDDQHRSALDKLGQLHKDEASEFTLGRDSLSFDRPEIDIQLGHCVKALIEKKGTSIEFLSNGLSLAQTSMLRDYLA